MKRMDRSQIIELLEFGKRATDIVEIVGCSLPMVYKVANEIKHDFKQRYVLDGNEETLKQILANGGNYSDIAREFGVSKNTAKLFCEKKGLGKPKEFNGDEHAVETIAERLPGFEYVSGYSGWDSRVKVRCKKCGTVTERSWITIRNGVASCEECEKVELLRRKEQRQAELQRQRTERQQSKLESKRIREEQKRLERIKICPVCGKETSRRKYCSDKCCDKAMNKKKEIKRREVIRERLVDNDITVRGLYKRDGGICYLCGKPCRLDDYITTDQAVVCGDWYPSIDHVVPLAKGGEHSWENVRLAHRKCNSLKSDRYSPMPLEIGRKPL